MLLVSIIFSISSYFTAFKRSQCRNMWVGGVCGVVRAHPTDHRVYRYNDVISGRQVLKLCLFHCCNRKITSLKYMYRFDFGIGLQLSTCNHPSHSMCVGIISQTKTKTCVQNHKVYDFSNDKQVQKLNIIHLWRVQRQKIIILQFLPHGTTLLRF